MIYLRYRHVFLENLLGCRIVNRNASRESFDKYKDIRVFGYLGKAFYFISLLKLQLRRKKSMTRWEWHWFRRRSAIEPIFGHLKSDNRLDRNYLRGKSGDRMNVMLTGCGYNMKMLLQAFLRSIWNRLFTVIDFKK